MVEAIPASLFRPTSDYGRECVYAGAGVHADGDNKANLYCNDLLPERFGRKREYALGKNSGKANILKNLEELGLELSPEQTRKVTERIIELGDKKELVTQEDLPYIVSDVLKHDTVEEHVRLLSYMVTTAYGLKPMAQVSWKSTGRRTKRMLPVTASSTHSCGLPAIFIRTAFRGSSRGWPITV